MPSSNRLVSLGVLEKADVDILRFSCDSRGHRDWDGRNRGGFKIFYDWFASTVASDDFDSFFGGGKALLANLDQLHALLVAHDQILEREISGLHFLDDLLEARHG